MREAFPIPTFTTRRSRVFLKCLSIWSREELSWLIFIINKKKYYGYCFHLKVAYHYENWIISIMNTLQLLTLRNCRNASTSKIFSTIMHRSNPCRMQVKSNQALLYNTLIPKQLSNRLITMPKRILSNIRYFSHKRPWRVNNQRRDWSNNPIFEGQNVLYMIIGSNVAVYCIWQYAEQNRKLKQFMIQNFMLSSYGVLQQFRIHTLITSVFSHRDGWHILSNMVTLYFFSQQSLGILGVSRYVFLYFGGGLVSSICMVIWPYCIPNSFPSGYRTSTYQAALGEINM